MLFNTTLMMSCFTPFISDYMYLNLRNGFAEDSKFNEDSIHFLQIPEPDDSLVHHETNQAVENMQKIIELSRKVRDQHNLPIKKPLKTLKIVDKNPAAQEVLAPFLAYIKDEVNTLDIVFETAEDEHIRFTVDYD